MAYDFLITDVVSKKAIDQLKQLNKEFKSTFKTYVSLATTMAKGVNTNPKTFDELSQKARNYTSILKSINQTQEKMASIHSEMLAVLRQVSQQLDSMSSLSKLNSLFEQFAKNVKNASDMLDFLSTSSNNVSSAQDNAAKSTQDASNTINQASAQLHAANLNYTAIIGTIRSFDGEVTKLTKDTIANKDAMKKLLQDIKDTAENYNDGKISVEEYLNETARLKQEHTQLTAQTQQYSALIKNHSTTIISASGSYYEMNAAMLELQKRYKALSDTDRNSDIGKNLIAQANALNTKLKEIDAQFGNYQRNVGNYSSAWNGLNVQTQQLIRELPSLTMGFNMFFLAISNNLPMFADEIRRATAEFKALKAQGQSATPVWKQLIGSLFSWQSALVVGITVLSMYGKEIAEWVTGLFKAKDALSETTIEMKALNNASKEGRKNAQREINQLNFLYKATTDENRSRKERKMAIDELRKNYPEYLKGVSDENIMAGKANDVYKQLSKTIIETSVAKSKMAEVDKLSTKAWDLSMKAARKLLEIRKAEKETDYVDPFSGEIIKAADRVEHLRKEYEGITKELRNVYSAQIAIIKGIKVSDIIDTDDKDEMKDYANYIKKITEDLEKSRIDLITEGREQEKEKIKKDFKDRMNEIKGNSEKEIELRENLKLLEKEALKEIDDKYDKELLEIEKTNLQNRLDSIGENSEEELNKRLDLQIQLNTMMRDAEVKAAEKTGEDVVAIQMKYKKKENDLIMKNLQERIGMMEKNTDRAIEEQETSALQEANVIKKQYADGKISKKDYEEKLYDVGIKYSKLRIQTLINEANAQRKMLDPSDPMYKDLEDRIANLQAQLDSINVDDAMKDKSKWADELSEALANMNSTAHDYLGDTANLFTAFTDIIDKFAKSGQDSFAEFWKGLDPKERAAMILASFGKIMDGITSIMSAMYDARIENLEKEQEANEEAYDQEVERIEKLEENGAISKEEAEARKRAAEDKTKQKDEEIAKKKAELQTKQAKWEKANAIIQTTISTSQAIMKALAETGPIVGAIFAAMIGAMGAAQVAVIAAQPIPKYAKGTKDHPGGLAIVGDGGKKEGILTESGMFISPDKPTLVDLPVHAQVIPDLSYIYDRTGIQSDYALLEKQLKEQRDNGIVVNVNSDYTRLEKKMESNTRELQNISRMLREANKLADYNNISRRL